MNALILNLYRAILRYEYPKMCVDLGSTFAARNEWQAIDIIRLENAIHAQLTSPNIAGVKAGLANIVFWGNYQQGTCEYRLSTFLADVTAPSLQAFIEFVDSGIYTPSRMAECNLPVFSRMSFISKALMFLDPTKFVTLDLQLAQLATLDGINVLSGLTATTSIPLTQLNVAIYARWCEHCRLWAAAFPPAWGVRAADVERGIFGIAQAGNRNDAVPFLAPPLAAAAA